MVRRDVMLNTNLRVSERSVRPIKSILESVNVRDVVALQPQTVRVRVNPVYMRYNGRVQCRYEVES